MNSIILVFLLLFVSQAQAQLQVGFYSQTCANAESIVKSVVTEATLSNPRAPPILLRLHFHDCFVEGCDASILIENGPESENKAAGHLGIGGFEYIAKAKQLIENECPGVVSCADIVAIAARDVVALVGGPVYEVETGRRDGRVSDSKLAVFMPRVDESAASLRSKFEKKGLSNEELIILSGAHTIGTAACFFMQKRLYRYNATNESDPEINPCFLPELKRLCPKNGDENVRIAMDPVTGDRFDNQPYQNIKNGYAVLASDARFYDDGLTKPVVDFYANGSRFGQDFANALVKLGRIGVKFGASGEIRRICNAFN
ncbi:peroxidase [Salvia divinorum]|uniref:Peroxidase n=1 Tax=Salvia divinorum TaxID=28513 RepID=A0ABD1I1I5_SALDI